MRVILFRGKREQYNYWLQGYFTKFHGMPDVYYIDGEEVIPETIGQFTGLLDKNGNKIFEGDIVRWSDGDYIHKSNPRIAVVEFTPELSFYAINCKQYNRINKYTKELNTGHKFGFSNFAYKDTNNHLEIIGNIHDNPELLEDNK